MNAHAGVQGSSNAEPASGPASESASESGRGRYHHGDLANALVRAAVALAREGGPEAVVLREAARQVGVSPAAAYRHFAGHDDLQYAVKLQAQQLLAAAMDDSVKGVEPADDPAAEALDRMSAIGFAYLHFALGEPGLFRTAFCKAGPSTQEQIDDDAEEEVPALAPGGASVEFSDLLQYRPFQILSESLDRLVEVGILSPDRRPNAEVPAWAMVHGLATLVLDGPLNLSDETARDAMLTGALTTVLNGLVN